MDVHGHFPPVGCPCGWWRTPKFPIDLALLTAVYTERSAFTVIVGAAIIDDGRVLAGKRAEPPEMAGRWEFPGGKVETGEDEKSALIRECQEELDARVEVYGRIGADVILGGGWGVLRVYAARLSTGDRPVALEHAELRWLGVDELESVEWLPADAPIVAALAPFLAGSAA